jgi:hypothetical protein
MAENAEKKAPLNSRWKIEENNVNWITGESNHPVIFVKRGKYG